MTKKRKKKSTTKPSPFRRVKNRTFLGFSLVEMLVVTTIVILIFSFVLVNFSRSSALARDARRQQDITMVKQALETYYEVYGVYPNASNFNQLMNNSSFAPYINNTRVQDPTNSGAYVYTYSSNGSSYQLNYQSEQSQTTQQNTSLTATSTPNPTSGATSTPTRTPTRTPTPTLTPIPFGGGCGRGPADPFCF